MSAKAQSSKPEAFPLTDKDRKILSLTDEDYKPHTWENLKRLIGNNDLHLLSRYPSQLKLYLEWTAETKEKYGSIMNFVLENRLHWDPCPAEECEAGSLFKVANPTPLTDRSDYRILRNDWPYGLDKGVTHLVVWLKHRLPSTPDKGDLMPESRVMLEAFVTTKFRSKFGTDNVLWFRNWIGLQSVRALEHIHVLLRVDGVHLEDL